MKVWYGYGSEHSMNLVMIGRFKEARDAKKVEQLIEKISKQLHAESDQYERSDNPEDHRFTKAMSELLRSEEIYSIGPTELEQFIYDAHVEIDGNELVITTDESDVSAFLKILLEHGARVEVYSAHKYPGTGHGRGG